MDNDNSSVLIPYKDEIHTSVNLLEKFLKRIEPCSRLGINHVLSSEEDINLLKELITRFDTNIGTLKQIYFDSTMEYIDSMLGNKISDRESLDIYTRIRDVYEQK